MYVGENKVFGVIGNKAIHLVKQEERSKTIRTEDMYIDIGAFSKEEAEEMVSPGDTASFDGRITDLFRRRIKAKALDDRVGCAVINLIERELPIDCYFAFTVQEEVGTRGAFGAAFRVKPDIALVLETTTAADLPSVKGVKRICTPGKGVVIPFMDGGTIDDRGLYKMMTAAADENKIPWQTKTMIAGGRTPGPFRLRGRGQEWWVLRRQWPISTPLPARRILRISGAWRPWRVYFLRRLENLTNGEFRAFAGNTENGGEGSCGYSAKIPGDR